MLKKAVKRGQSKTKKHSRLSLELAKSNYIMFKYNVDLKTFNQLRLVQQDSDKPLTLNFPN